MNPRTELAQIGPLAQLRAGRLVHRFAQLLAGLVVYGLSIALMVRGGLGLSPWDALHMGLTHHLPFSFGWVLILVSFAVLLLWIPLREMPGIGTVLNATLIGLVVDPVLLVLPAPETLAVRLIFTVSGVFLCGFATALYMGAQLGRGARDGLMTGLSRVTGLSLRLVRTSLEVIVLIAGLLLGGWEVLGLGTILFALFIGPLTQAMLPRMLVQLDSPPGR